jgi:hypothetical protein
VVDADVIETRDVVDVDQHLRDGEPELHHRQQEGVPDALTRRYPR